MDQNPTKIQSHLPDSRRTAVEDEINVLDLMLVLVKNKKTILSSMVAAFVIACVVTLLMPNIYVATAKILPPQQEQSGLAAMLAGMGDLSTLAGGAVGGSSSIDLYVSMLKSRTVADAVIDRNDLMTVHNEKYRTIMYQKLNKLVHVSAGKKDGIITISVEDRDGKRAADIANTYIEELKQLSIRLNLSNAGRERIFLEDRLKLVKADLAQAEENLREFQQKNKAIKIDDQASAIIEAISNLKGELASKEVELGVLLSYQTEQNPEVRSLREVIAQLKGQLRRMEQSPAGSKIADDIFITTASVPDLGIQYARHLRDFKAQETLFELLTKQYEVTKFNAAKNTSPLQVLDEAVVPDRKSKPKRELIVTVATFAAGLIAVLAALVREYWQRMSEADRLRWRAVRDLLRMNRRKTEDGSI